MSVETEPVEQDATLWRIAEEVQQILREQVTFSPMGEDTTREIKDDAIVIRRPDEERGDDDSEGAVREIKPGILIKPYGFNVPVDGGSNCEDDYICAIACEIIDKDNLQNIGNYRSHLKWEEQIAKAFNQRELPLIAGPDVYVDLSIARSTKNIQQKQWKRHDLFRGAVELEFTAREYRRQIA